MTMIYLKFVFAALCCLLYWVYTLQFTANDRLLLYFGLGGMAGTTVMFLFLCVLVRTKFIGTETDFAADTDKEADENVGAGILSGP